MKRKHLENLCESIDASVFSSDMLYCDEDLAMFDGYVSRWIVAIDERKQDKLKEAS